MMIELTESGLLPCITKRFLGIDCPGCGLQRSVVYLLQGRFQDAFGMYPAIYTLIPLFGVLVVYLFRQPRFAHRLILWLGLLNAAVILTHYILKFI